MTKRERTRTAHFVGGPLDGVEQRKTTPGRWPIYLDEMGQPLRTFAGDRIMRTGEGSCYIHRVTLNVEHLPIHTYVHSSVTQGMRNPA